MSNEFECIGFKSQHPLMQHLDALIDAGTPDAPNTLATRHLRWTDASGASVAVDVAKAEGIECVRAFFSPAVGLSRWSVRMESLLTNDRDCQYCGGAVVEFREGGETKAKTGVQWLQFQPLRSALRESMELEIEVAAFARELGFFSAGDAFDQGQREFWSLPDGSAPRHSLAENAFIPEGLMMSGPAKVSDQATTLLCGPVVSAERLKNAKTGLEFGHVRVNTLVGLTDVVFDPTSCKGIAEVGHIALVRAWLVARPVDLVARRGGLLGRLVGLFAQPPNRP